MIFPICSGMVRGFSRFVPFLLLGLLRAPTKNSPERVRDTIWTFPEKSGKPPGLETPQFSSHEKCPTQAESAQGFVPWFWSSTLSGSCQGRPQCLSAPTARSFWCHCALKGSALQFCCDLKGVQITKLRFESTAWVMKWAHRRIKVTQKWLKSDLGRPTPKWLKSDSGPYFWVIFDSLLSPLGSLGGGTPESLLGGRPLHKAWVTFYSNLWENHAIWDPRFEISAVTPWYGWCLGVLVLSRVDSKIRTKELHFHAEAPSTGTTICPPKLPPQTKLDLSGHYSDLFSRVLFSSLPRLLATPLPPLFSAHFRPFPPSKSALFCRGKGTAQSLERGRSGMDLSTKFGKEIPSRNLRKKRSVLA